MNFIRLMGTPMLCAQWCMLFIVGCAADTGAIKYDQYSSVTRSNQRVNSDCRDASADFAERICGGFERRVTEEKWHARTEKETIQAAADLLLQNNQSPSIDTAEWARTQTFNVLQEHLASELKDTRHCRVNISKLSIRNCETHQCRSRCDDTRQKNSDIFLSNKKSFNTCLRTKESSCNVRCRMGTGMSNYSKCKAECSASANKPWKNECESNNLSASVDSLDTINNQHRMCLLDCKK